MDTQNSVLDGYVSEEELARQLRKSVRTLKRWRAKRIGPPVTYNGKTPIYEIEAAREALKTQGRKPRRGVG